VASSDGVHQRRGGDRGRDRLVDPSIAPIRSRRVGGTTDRGISGERLYGDESFGSWGGVPSASSVVGAFGAPADFDLVGVVVYEGTPIDACIATRYNMI